ERGGRGPPYASTDAANSTRRPDPQRRQPPGSTKRSPHPTHRSCSSDRLERKLVAGVCRGRQSQSPVPMESARMITRATVAGKLPMSVGTIFLAGLLLTTGQSHAQATCEASTAGSGIFGGDNGGNTL